MSIKWNVVSLYTLSSRGKRSVSRAEGVAGKDVGKSERRCAHVTICVLAYLLFNTLEKRVSKLVELSASDMLDELAKCKMHTITTKSGIECVKTLTRFTENQISILKHLECKPKAIENHFKRLIAIS